MFWPSSSALQHDYENHHFHPWHVCHCQCSQPPMDPEAKLLQTESNFGNLKRIQDRGPYLIQIQILHMLVKLSLYSEIYLNN